jgi:hypothetical protein
VLVAALFCPGYRARLDSRTLESRSTLDETQGVVRKVDKRINDYEVVRGKGRDEETKIKSLARLFGYRELWPSLLTMISRSIEAVAPDQPRLIGYARYVALKELHRNIHEKITAGKGEELSARDLETAAAVLLGRTGIDPNSPAGLRDELARKAKEAEAFKATERKARKTIVLESLTPTYVRNLALARAPAGGPVAKAAPPTGRSSPGFKVELVARTPLPRIEANKMVADLRAYSVALARWLGSLSVEEHEVAWLPMTAEAVGFKRPITGGPVAARIPDPLMPDDPNEDMAQDTRFKITWWVAVEGDGIVTADVKLGREYKLAKGIQVLKPGTIIAVGKDPRNDLKMKGTTPWYRVKATGAADKGLGGWVSGAALDKQKLEDVTAGP